MIVDIFLNRSTQVERSDKEFFRKERLKRSLLKTVSWRLLGTFDTIVISYWVTGGLDQAFAIGSIELITKMLLFFFHERLWNKIGWGK